MNFLLDLWILQIILYNCYSYCILILPTISWPEPIKPRVCIFFKKNNQNLNFTTYRMGPVWGVDFHFRGSADYNFYVFKNPFDYIEKGDAKLHTDTEISQFRSIFIKLELFKVRKRVFKKAAKVVTSRLLQLWLWTYQFLPYFKFEDIFW